MDDAVCQALWLPLSLALVVVTAVRSSMAHKKHGVVDEKLLRSWLIARLITLAPASQRARFARLQSDTESVGCSTCKGCATDAPSAAPVKTIQLHRR